ncbi:choline-sulfatase [Micromonospora sp. NBRC 101691]|uniref:choline-sulfatase n=1 Tax=Micromonospora sp. NBRC 101691 TaxID=3032198 RepID=UPI0024A0157D|nr:choline-sulfatase [Micromonospora sp. NBRC 101691]GLY24989.1 choline-sulfatase [Micromonospora sp. NBRC 101691]
MTTAGSRPNILLLMADQLSAFATGPYGNEDVLTPNLDALAERGTVFENAYCNAPLCVPSRAAMMTGRLPSGVPSNDNAEEFPASVPTFAHSLRRAGYRTILSGKMHFVGPDQLHGFEERLTTDIFPPDLTWTRPWEEQGDPPRLSGAQQNGGREYVDILRSSGPLPWTYQMHYDEEVRFTALRRIRELALDTGERAGEPWLMVASFTQPHDPYVAPPEYWNRYEGRRITLPEPVPDGVEPHPLDRWVNAFHGVDRAEIDDEAVRLARRGYYAMTSYIDDVVGSFVAELERFGLLDDTVVVFTSDHGDQLGEHGMYFKRTLREWSVRVPLLFAGPRVASGRRVGTPTSLVDLHPTFADLAGAALPEWVTGRFAGDSLTGLLAGDAGTAHPHRDVVVENSAEGTLLPVRAVVSGRHKLVYAHGLPDQLYDLEKDPRELDNRAADPGYAEVRGRLRSSVLTDWDPVAAERDVVTSQRVRAFLGEALAHGAHTSWAYEPPVDAARQWIRGTDDDPWDPLCGF